MFTKILIFITGISLLGAILVQFSGYPKLIVSEKDVEYQASNQTLALRVTHLYKDTTKHLLKNSATFNLTTTLTINAITDRRIENTNFWLNCYNGARVLITCTEGKIIPRKEIKLFDFSRDWSRISKTPLDVTLTSKSDKLSYSPEFFGLSFAVDSVALLYSNTPYSRTNLQDLVPSELAIPIKLDFVIQ